MKSVEERLLFSTIVDVKVDGLLKSVLSDHSETQTAAAIESAVGADSSLRQGLSAVLDQQRKLRDEEELRIKLKLRNRNQIRVMQAQEMDLRGDGVGGKVVGLDDEEDYYGGY